MRTPLVVGLFFLLWAPFVAQGQQHAAAVPDSSGSAVRAKSPKIAALCSVIPGGGQVYNGKYWKVPVVYGIIGGAGYLVYSNHDKYVYYRTENRLRLNGATEGLNPDLRNMSTENVAAYERYYQRNQELYAFVFAVCYGLNIVDAMVDAHFSTYDVSERLSMQLRPYVAGPDFAVRNAAPTWGLCVVFRGK
ncbi:MAG: hypothetical protein J5873_02725 [Bacteroidales bacterium]|nr:hypothetical protein [Bacteroidales bacterium]